MLGRHGRFVELVSAHKAERSMVKEIPACLGLSLPDFVEFNSNAIAMEESGASLPLAIVIWAPAERCLASRKMGRPELAGTNNFRGFCSCLFQGVDTRHCNLATEEWNLLGFVVVGRPAHQEGRKKKKKK